MCLPHGSRLLQSAFDAAPRMSLTFSEKFREDAFEAAMGLSEGQDSRGQTVQGAAPVPRISFCLVGKFDCKGHYGVGGSIAGPRSAPEQEGEP